MNESSTNTAYEQALAHAREMEREAAAALQAIEAATAQLQAAHRAHEEADNRRRQALHLLRLAEQATGGSSKP